MRPWLSILLIVPVVGMIGCAYRLGPTNGEKAGDRSIKIAPFENKTIEPRLIEAVSAALRRDPDLIVTGSILKYERDAISVRPTDALSPLDMRIIIHARVIAKERVSGKVVLDREISGRTEVRAQSDLVSAERQALPLAARNLARSATALIVDGTW
jgi:hypothetical protein